MMKYILFLFLLSNAVAQTFDGPAELPRTIPPHAMADTPTGSTVIKNVAATDSLQVALAGAQCGDTFLLDPAGNWTVSKFVAPARGCDDQHWIWVMTAGALPPEGTRITRPYPWLVTVLQMPRITVTQIFEPGDHYRFIGVEVTRPLNTGTAYNLFGAPTGGTHHLVIDRSYFHGTSKDETARGITLSNIQHAAVVDSIFDEFHCQAVTGACSDAQAISGGTSVYLDGDYYIHNNELVASGENIIFGGGGATQTPCDVTVDSNYMHKWDSWNPKDPSYGPAIAAKDGLPHPWIVKNLDESKNVCRMLVEKNVMSGSWGGFSQSGWAILVGAKNQSGACPGCKTTDITIRYNSIHKTGTAMQLGCSLSDAGAPPLECDRVSIHGNKFAELQYSTCNLCGHGLVQISSIAAPLLHDLSVVNNTFELEGKWLGPNPGDGTFHGFLVLAAAQPPSIPYNIHFDNNVFPTGGSPLSSTGGGTANCVNTYVFTSYKNLFANCWGGTSSFTGNVAFTQGWTGKQDWPDGNYVLPNAGADTNVLP